jgi:hypothetical protein
VLDSIGCCARGVVCVTTITMTGRHEGRRRVRGPATTTPSGPASRLG